MNTNLVKITRIGTGQPSPAVRSGYNKSMMVRKSTNLHETKARDWYDSLIDFCRVGSLLCLVILGPNSPLQADQRQDNGNRSQNVDLTSERKVLREMIIEGRAQTALDTIQSLRTDHPSDSGLALLEGEAYYALDQMTAAVSAFKTGLKLDPGKQGKLFNLGRALQALGQDQEALQVFNQMQKQPEVSFRTRGLFGAGLSKQNLGDDQAARLLFQQSLQLDPTFDRGRYRLALLLMRAQPEQALAMFDEILMRDPLHHGSAYNRALALRNLKRTEQAQKAMNHYRKILEGRSRISLLRERWAMNVQDIELILELGRVHRELGAIAEALRWYSRGGIAAPSDPRPAVESVRTLLEAGRRADAIELVRRLQDSPAAGPARALLDKQNRSKEP